MTGTLKARVGGAWVPILGSGQEAANTARWNSAWGVVASAVLGSAFTTTVAPSVILQVTFTAVAGRVYKLSFRGWGSNTASASIIHTSIRLDNSTSGTIIADGRISTPYANAQYAYDATIDQYVFATAGSHTLYAVWEYPNGATMLVNAGDAPAKLVVTDVGPATPASIAPPTAGPRVVASGNALGIVAMGATTNAVHSVAANTAQNVTYPLAFTPQVGRRYRLVCRIRAVSALGNSAYLAPVTTGTTLNGEYWRWISGGYDGMDAEWVFEGNGVASTFQVLYQGVAASVFTDLGSSAFYLEDVGPSMSPALPIPQTFAPWVAMPWYTTPPSQGGAGNWDVDPGGWYFPMYRKVGDTVTLRGRIFRKNSTAGTSNLNFGLLPAGYRPPPLTTPMFTTPRSDNYMSQLYVDPGGAIGFIGGAIAPGLAVSSWVALDVISFSTS